MQFGKRDNRSSTARLKNPFVGIASANTVAGLGILNRQARLKQAAELRQISKVLGMPPTELEDEMLAGGDITINHGSGVWPWVVAGLCILLLAGGVGVWLLGASPKGPVSNPTPPATPQPPVVQPATKGSDYIEFFKP